MLLGRFGQFHCENVNFFISHSHTLPTPCLPFFHPPYFLSHSLTLLPCSGQNSLEDANIDTNITYSAVTVQFNQDTCGCSPGRENVQVYKHKGKGVRTKKLCTSSQLAILDTTQSKQSPLFPTQHPNPSSQCIWMVHIIMLHIYC